MYKVIIKKPGKRLNFQGRLYTTPCNFYVEDKQLDLAKLILKKAGINDNFSIQPMVESKARKEANKQAEQVVMEAAKKASEEVVAKIEEAPKAEEQPVQAPAPSKKNKKK
jgi:hypothetical protein